MNNEDKVSIDWGGVRGAQWMGASGIIGLLVNAAFQPGGILNRFGAGGLPPGGPGAPVSREVMDLTTKLARVEAERHADNLNAGQAVWNAHQEEKIACQQRQIDQLYTLTKLTIPNGNLTPGVGPVQVVPVPPVAPDVTALAAAIVAAMSAAKTTPNQQGQ